MKKILVVNDHGSSHYRPFSQLGESVGAQPSGDYNQFKQSPEDFCLVIFTGGSDVTPELYGRKAHPKTSYNLSRDRVETEVLNIATEKQIPMAGICRGAQLLCVAAGGILVQDVTGHQMCSHDVISRWPDGQVKQISVSGDHHQMQYPFGLPSEMYDILAWGSDPRSKHYAFDPDNIVPAGKADQALLCEPDVVWYENINALAIQYHPEWMDEGSDGFKYCQMLADSYLKPRMELNNAVQQG